MPRKIILIRDGVADARRDITDDTDFDFDFASPPLDTVTFEAGVQISSELVTKETVPFTTEAVAVVTQPQFLGDVVAGFPVEIQPATFTGTPAAQVTTTFTLDGASVTLPETNIYDVPAGTEGQTLFYGESAINSVVDGVGDLIAQTPSVSETVLTPVAPALETVGAIQGTPGQGSVVNLVLATFTGTPDPDNSSTFQLLLDGVDVTANVSGSSYTIPLDATAGVSLTLITTGDNGVGSAVTDTVSVTAEESTLLLDNYPGAEVAYSLRQLSSSTTHVARVQRSSDDAEDDFTASEITNGTLTTWVGAGNDGFVVTRYDQSGNGRHSTQSTPASRMKIVDSGILVAENGRPMLLHDGVDDGYSFTPPALIDDLLVVCVQVATSSSARRLLSMSASGSDDYRDNGLIVGRNLFGFSDITDGGGDASRIDTPEPPLNQLYIRSCQKNTTAFNVRENGSEIASKSTIAETIIPTSAVIGYSSSSGLGASKWIGTLGDMIVYASDESANLSAIEQDVADYYGITLA